MRLRTLIELLVALTLTFAAVVAISKMARATSMKVETAHAHATVGEAKTGAVYMTLNNVGSEPDRACSPATDAAQRTA
jgi:copper(I)-binding protein